MNNPESKLPFEDPRMDPRKIEKSLKRIENDLYYNSDSILVRLGRIEEKLKKDATISDLGCLRSDMGGLKSELIAHSNSLFRWTIVIYVLVGGTMLAVLKLT